MTIQGRATARAGDIMAAPLNAPRPLVAMLALTASSLALAAAPAYAQTTVSTVPASTLPPHGEIPELVVNGIPFHETVLPTRLSSSSVYGLDLNVMDTPRNTTLLSTTQLETLNIQDPRAFSYLTASSYTDSAFGTPNIPRIRGQYADVFYNGMRSSFSENGYGVPLNFDSFDTINITKGPASVIDGPGPGVGGEADFTTKRPNLSRAGETLSASVDSVGNRRLMADVSLPLISHELGLLVSYSGEDSDSYFYGHFFRKNAIYAALRWRPNDQYQLDFNTEINVEQYTENVGLNRVNQNLIDHGLYLQGAPSGELYSSLIGSSAIPIGSAANPYSPVVPILTELNLTNAAPINTKITIDQTPQTESRGVLYTAQLIQKYQVNDKLSFENNTFFDYQDSDNQEAYYYADASRGSFTIENRTDVHYDFDFPFSFGQSGAVKNQIVAGVTFRFAHVDYISDYNAETISVYDLTSNPRLWTYNGAYQTAYADAYLYKSSLGKIQYGVPGRDPTSAGNTGVSDLYDGAIFFQDRIEFTPKFSFLYGARLDAVQDHTHDPLGGDTCCLYYSETLLPQNHDTSVYGLINANTSAVYKFAPWISTYLTVDFTQSVNPDGGEGGVNAYGQVPDSTLMRQDSYLYEAGLKLNLLNDKLFVGSALFDQRRAIPIGVGGTETSQANIRGVEVELNYQPRRNFFATASYSYIKTTLNKAAPFYNYPAESGTFIDGAGVFAIFKAGQTFNDPGVPQHIFNLLANYKFDNGIGLRSGLQVTGPIETTTSGQLDLDDSSYVPADIVANGGYYKSPVIPWQYTLNASIFYNWKQYTFTFSIYNLTDQLNWQSSTPYYGNDTLVRNDPRTFEFRVQAKY